MSLDQVIAGDMSSEALRVKRPGAPALALRRIFESQEVGVFQVALSDGERVPVGHDALVVLILCLAGEIALTAEGRDMNLAVGAYAVIPEGEAAEIAAQDGAAEALLFFGLDQLPGAFFNSYGSANV